jgi:phosphoserine phosphatase
VTAALSTWRASPARDAILGFVERITAQGGADFVPPAERIAVFDNDGTLWCEKPMPIELGFLLERFAAMAEHDESLRARQPWKAAHERDFGWLGAAMTKHYNGDDSDVRILMGAILEAFAGHTVEQYVDGAERFLRNGAHPTLGRRLLACAYAPMVELLGYLEQHGFTNYIASGGDRDFMRPVTEELYAIPSERVIGSSNALQWTDDEHGGTVRYQAAPDIFDDGPVKPVRIWSRIGRRPILAAGNSNGDIPMLRYAGGPTRPALRLLVLHDDDEREFAYTGGAEQALEQAAAQNWTVASIKRDWAAVFAD